MCQIGSRPEVAGAQLTFQPCLTPESLGCLVLAFSWERLCQLAQRATVEHSGSPSLSMVDGGASTSASRKSSRRGSRRLRSI